MITLISHWVSSQRQTSSPKTSKVDLKMSSSEDSRQNELKTDLKLKRLQKTISTLRRQLSLSLLVIRCISGLVRVPNLYFGSIQYSWGP